MARPWPYKITKLKTNSNGIRWANYPLILKCISHTSKERKEFWILQELALKKCYDLT